MSMLQPLRRPGIARRLTNDDSGTASIEFVVMFPLIILILTIAFETGVLATRKSMLDRATNVAVRELRLGTANPPSHQELKEQICRTATIIPDCINSVHVELAPVSLASWDLDRGPVMCVDREQDIAPVTAFRPGQSNELMLVRVCAVFEPIYPMAGLALDLQYVNDNDYALVAMSAFVNEP